MEDEDNIKNLSIISMYFLFSLILVRDVICL
jgi:hypothetical protein